MKKNVGLGVMGLPCSSFVLLYRGCTYTNLIQLSTPVSCGLRSRDKNGRDIINPAGNTGYGFVHAGNVLLARTILIILVLCSRQCRWLLEQPSSSNILDTYAMQWLLERAPVSCLQYAWNRF